MPHITYLPDEGRIESAPDETILDTSLRVKIPHAHVCGGHGRCSTCRVMVLDGLEHCSPRTSLEEAMAQRLHFPPDIRLACQTRLSGNGEVTVRRLVLDTEDAELTSQLTTDRTPISAGQEKTIAILFADIRGFTAFSEALPPYDVIYVLNRYFHRMNRVITSHGGYIDNYMGDGLMALFGVDDAEHATLRAIRAGLDMLAAVKELKPYLEGVYDMSFEIGIGIHYGDVVVGRIGARDERRMTAIGDAVNLASRIEEANKEFDTHLLVSEAAYDVVWPQVRPGKRCPGVALKGKSGLYNLYEIIGLADGL